jgi:D-alanyl-D-alanine carboxypeptidase (penicillin-binding protein 5/6)
MPKPGKARQTYEIYNLDRLLQQDYPGMVGGKTGYTTNAGRTFVGAAKQGDRTLIISIMRTTQFLDKAGRKLLNWGFANASAITPLGELPTADSPSTPRPTTDNRHDTASVPIAAAVVGATTSTVDLPWLALALTVFLTLLVVAVLLRIRQVMRRTRTST